MAIARINKQKATQLRMAGFNYAQIADYMGCSYDWCATRLSAVKPEQKHAAIAMSAYLKYLEDKKEEQCNDLEMA